MKKKEFAFPPMARGNAVGRIEVNTLPASQSGGVGGSGQVKYAGVNVVETPEANRTADETARLLQKLWRRCREQKIDLWTMREVEQHLTALGLNKPR